MDRRVLQVLREAPGPLTLPEIWEPFYGEGKIPDIHRIVTMALIRLQFAHRVVQAGTSGDLHESATYAPAPEPAPSRPKPQQQQRDWGELPG